MIVSDPLDTPKRRIRQQRTAARRNARRADARPRRVEFGGLHHNKIERAGVQVRTASWLNRIRPSPCRWVRVRQVKGAPARFRLVTLGGQEIKW